MCMWPGAGVVCGGWSGISRFGLQAGLIASWWIISCRADMHLESHHLSKAVLMAVRNSTTF